MVKIYKIYKCDGLSEWDLSSVKNKLADADWFIYNYKIGSWDGIGFALWKKDNKYGYAYLGHCSCRGPIEDLNSIMYTLSQIKKLAAKGDYEWSMAPAVMAKLKDIQAKEI